MVVLKIPKVKPSHKRILWKHERPFCLLKTQGIFLPAIFRSTAVPSNTNRQKLSLVKTLPSGKGAILFWLYPTVLTNTPHCLNVAQKNISSNTKPLNPGSTDGPTELIRVFVTWFWFRPAWSRESELEQLWAGAAPSAESSPVVLCNRRDLPGLYLNPGSSKREPAFCLIMSHLTCTNIFKTSLHKRAQERRRVQGIKEQGQGCLTAG